MEVEVVSEEGGDTVTPTSTTSTGGVSTDDATTDRVTTDASDGGKDKNEGLGTKKLNCHVPQARNVLSRMYPVLCPTSFSTTKCVCSIATGAGAIAGVTVAVIAVVLIVVLLLLWLYCRYVTNCLVRQC